jgi:hypothetical protein
MLVPAATQVSLSVALAGSNVQLSFPTQSGLTYQVWRKFALTDANWTLISTVAGDGSVKTVLDGIVPGQGFYRLSIQ